MSIEIKSRCPAQEIQHHNKVLQWGETPRWITQHKRLRECTAAHTGHTASVSFHRWGLHMMHISAGQRTVISSLLWIKICTFRQNIIGQKTPCPPQPKKSHFRSLFGCLQKNWFHDFMIQSCGGALFLGKSTRKSIKEVHLFELLFSLFLVIGVLVRMPLQRSLPISWKTKKKLQTSHFEAIIR